MAEDDSLIPCRTVAGDDSTIQNLRRYFDDDESDTAPIFSVSIRDLSEANCPTYL